MLDLYIIRELLKRSDSKHPITCDMLVDLIQRDFNYSTSRKTILSHINTLRNCFEEFSIIKDGNRGFYLENRFVPSYIFNFIDVLIRNSNFSEVDKEEMRRILIRDYSDYEKEALLLNKRTQTNGVSLIQKARTLCQVILNNALVKINVYQRTLVVYPLYITDKLVYAYIENGSVIEDKITPLADINIVSTSVFEDVEGHTAKYFEQKLAAKTSSTNSSKYEYRFINIDMLSTYEDSPEVKGSFQLVFSDDKGVPLFTYDRENTSADNIYQAFKAIKNYIVLNNDDGTPFTPDEFDPSYLDMFVNKYCVDHEILTLFNEDSDIYVSAKNMFANTLVLLTNVLYDNSYKVKNLNLVFSSVLTLLLIGCDDCDFRFVFMPLFKSYYDSIEDINCSKVILGRKEIEENDISSVNEYMNFVKSAISKGDIYFEEYLIKYFIVFLLPKRGTYALYYLFIKLLNSYFNNLEKADILLEERKESKSKMRKLIIDTINDIQYNYFEKANLNTDSLPTNDLINIIKVLLPLK